MKYYSYLFLFFLTIHSSWSQDLKRLLINGQIIVFNNDVEDISIYNTSTKKGTITNNKGEFSLEVGLNDKLEISALLYKKKTIIINRVMLKNKKIKISLIESINALDEVIILPYELTGNIAEDVKSSKVVEPQTFSFSSFEDYDFPDDYKSKVENIATNGHTIRESANLIAIFKEVIKLFKKNKKEKKSKGSLSARDIEISNKYSTHFISENFDIPEDEVGLFLQYAENNGLTEALLRKENEMQLIAFLFEKRENYLLERQDED